MSMRFCVIIDVLVSFSAATDFWGRINLIIDDLENAKKKKKYFLLTNIQKRVANVNMLK